MPYRHLSLRQTFRDFQAPGVVAAGFLGVPVGVIYPLVVGLLQIWFADAGVAKSIIGYLPMVFIPHYVKFLWAPFIDRFSVPFLTTWLGQRRSWGVLTEVMVVLGLIVLGWGHPEHSVAWSFGAAFWVSFWAACQDIVIDAYRIESLVPTQYGPGSSLYIFGYRIGSLATYVTALHLSHSGVEWSWIYVLLSIPMLVGIGTFLSAPEPVTTRHLKRHFWSESIHDPARDLFNRPGIILLIAYIFVFKWGDNLISNMANVFYLDIGFSKIDLANVTKFFGVFAMIFGGILGGIVVRRWSAYATLVLATFMHISSDIMYIVLAKMGAVLHIFYVAVAVENVTEGMLTAAFIAYLSRLCRKEYAVTQYALLSSVWSFGNILAYPAGKFAEALGWTQFFVVSLLCAVPGVLLLLALRAYPRLIPKTQS